MRGSVLTQITSSVITVVAPLALTRGQFERLTTTGIASLQHHFAFRCAHPERALDDKMMAFQDSELAMSPDLSAAFVAAFRDTQGKAAAAITCADATTSALALLNGHYVAPSGDPRQFVEYTRDRGFLVPIPPDAIERMARQGLPAVSPHLRLQVSKLRVIRFRTDLGLVVAEIVVGAQSAVQPTVDLLQEVLARLAPTERAPGLSWAAESPAHPDRAHFDLAMLLQGLVCGSGASLISSSRLYTYTFATLSGLNATKDLPKHVTKLSQHHTSAYQDAEPDLDAQPYLPFVNIAHAMHLEGGALIGSLGEDQNDAPPFIRDGGLLDRYRKAYLPIVMLATHNRIKLDQLIERADDLLTTAHPALRLSEIGGLIRELREFDRFFALSSVSVITMHNRVFELARRAFDLAAQELIARDDRDELTKLQSFVFQQKATAAAEAAERDATERNDAYHARERGRAGFLGIFAGFLTFLSASSALKFLWLAWKSIATPQGYVFSPDIAQAFLSLAVALLAGAVTYRRQKDEHRHGAHGGHHAPGEIGREVGRDLESEGANTGAKLAAKLSSAVAVESSTGHH